MNTLSNDINLNKAMDIIFRVINPDKIILFGSRAKGNYTDDSDYDLLILTDSIKDKRKKLSEIYRNLLGLKLAIDIIIETKEDYVKNKDNKFMIYNTIEKEGNVLYERK